MEHGGGENLEGVGGEERVIRIYCLRYFFSIKKKGLIRNRTKIINN